MGDAAGGFGYSIYFMLLCLFGLIGWLVFTIVRAVRRAEAASEVASSTAESAS